MERYQISKKIGEGTGGVVFLAEIVTPSPTAAEYGLAAGPSPSAPINPRVLAFVLRRPPERSCACASAWSAQRPAW
jgi:hypothetical protein